MPSHWLCGVAVDCAVAVARSELLTVSSHGWFICKLKQILPDLPVTRPEQNPEPGTGSTTISLVLNQLIIFKIYILVGMVLVPGSLSRRDSYAPRLIGDEI